MSKTNAPLYIAAGTLTTCVACKAPLRAPRDILPEEFPLETVCPFCKTARKLNSTVTPKVDPSIAFKAEPFHILSDTNKPKELADGEIPSPEDALKSVPFYDVTSSIGNHTSAIFSDIKTLQGKIEEFRLNVIHFFQNQWRYYARFRDSWDHRHMQEWMDFPFTCFPVLSEDDLSAAYGRYIFAPKFFNPMFGFKVPHAIGGMRFELVNQFSRMNFPLETFFCERFDLPQSLDLRVVGNKIIGGSLSLCWKDIPGVKPDNDHTEDMASVFIQDPASTKRWLSNHGVNPWEARPIAKDELNFNKPFDQIEESPAFTDAWGKFMKYGRLGVFWSDAMASRQFGTLVGLSLRGTTLVFVSGHKEKMAWDSLYSLASKRQRIGSELAFAENGEVIMWPQFMRAKSAIVDLHGPIDAEVIEKLYEFKGRVLVLAPDPIMDFHSINIECNRVHGLCGFETFETPEWENTPVKKVYFGHALTALEKSIKGMRDHQDHRNSGFPSH